MSPLVKPRKWFTTDTCIHCSATLMFDEHNRLLNTTARCRKAPGRYHVIRPGGAGTPEANARRG